MIKENWKKILLISSAVTLGTLIVKKYVVGHFTSLDFGVVFSASILACILLTVIVNQVTKGRSRK